MPTKDTPVACCPACEAPLIPTMEAPKFEFFCQVCKKYFEFLRPIPKPPTPERLARLSELTAKFTADVARRASANEYRQEWLAETKGKR